MRLLSLLAALSLVGCAYTPNETLSEPEPRETDWRIGDDAAGLSADMGLGFMALPTTTSAPSEATSSEAGPTQAEAVVAESMPASVESMTDESTTQDANATETTKRRSLTISLSDQAFEYKEDDAVVHAGPISSGKAGHSTPAGRFKVLSKNADKVSSRYTNQLGMQAWMPYSIQFHGHYFLHEGWLPGYPDSHGCVRVGEKDARFLFERLRIGDPILVAN
ncbi:L,D-transpeptidase [Allochromatium palmeri]|uniref:L,D-transpeptidase family protein n=1 Tax=Allochromatium palmeri TaxID=231048 RepID=A0A6N8EH65_9GAMM|nr:L,D-transpeptidase [Allochromatium palmeri]MTW21837.1 L,D-transpeptidase family protein [Allochromatium palmeri]